MYTSGLYLYSIFPYVFTIEGKWSNSKFKVLTVARRNAMTNVDYYYRVNHNRQPYYLTSGFLI